MCRGGRDRTPDFGSWARRVSITLLRGVTHAASARYCYWILQSNLSHYQLHVPVQLPCYDFVPITNLPTCCFFKYSQKLKHPFHNPYGKPAFRPWRAVCTELQNLFTAAWLICDYWRFQLHAFQIAESDSYWEDIYFETPIRRPTTVIFIVANV